MLSRLKVRTKLLTILLPLLLAIGVLATLGVLNRLDQRGDAQRTVQLVGTARVSASVVHDLQIERLLFAALQNGYAPAGPLVDKAKLVTDRDAGRLRVQLATLRDAGGTIAGDTPAQVATSVEQQLDGITGAREVYNPRSGAASSITDVYTGIIQSLIATDANLMTSSTGVDSTGQSLHWLSTAKESDARSAADVTTIIADTAAGRVSDANFAVSDVSGLQSDATNAIKVFSTDASEYGRRVLDGVLRDARYNASQGNWASIGSIDPKVGLSMPTGSWLTTAQGRLDAVRVGESAVFNRELASATSRADDLERQVRLYLGGSATALLLALLLATSVTRAITTSLRRLTDAARIISTEQLPKLVDSLKHPDADHSFHVTDINLHSEDEFADLAKAFNAVEQTALDVAAEQVATLRKGISDLFVNLARRNQSLLDRQIEFIDRLEANEEDPDQLENLFKLDHLATRMRRNAESLLVLAGAEAPRRRTKEVSLTDVIRVAVGEVEDFSRITLLAVDEAHAIGSAAVDVAHLLSELMENGTQYSPPERRVEVVGHRTNDGGYVVSLSDQGIGMEPEAMAEANRLLARPPAVGLSLSRSLGFVVIATLAHRHGITVRLTEAPSGGVAALVTLPPPLLVHAEAPLTSVHPEPLRTQIVADSGISAAVTGPLVAPEQSLPDLDLGQWIQQPTSPFVHHRDDEDTAPPQEVEVSREEVTARWSSEATDGESSLPPFALDDDPFAGFDVSTGPTEPTSALSPPTDEESSPSIGLWEPPDEVPVEQRSEADEGPQPEPQPEPQLEPQPAMPVEHAESMQPATSMADALPMGLAFEQGLFALLDHPDGRTEAAVQPEAPQVDPPDSVRPAGPYGDPTPLATEMHPLLPPSQPSQRDHTDQIADEPIVPAMPMPLPTPLPTATPLVAPGLPQRRPKTPAAMDATDNIERIGSPSRPPEEIRSILSRYRSGLQTGRAETDDTTDGPTEPTFPDYE